MAIGANMTKRDQTMAAIAFVALALAGAYWYLAYSPKSLELAEVETRVDALELVNERARRDVERGTVEQLRAEAELAQANLALLRRLVPTSNEVPLLVDQVSTAARQAGLEIGGIQPQPVLPGVDFDTHRFNIGLIGGYHEVGRFLSNVGSLSRIVAPINVKMNIVDTRRGNISVGRRAGQTLIQTDLEIRTYVARTQPADSPAAGGGQ
jgi:type IV pilus assembly protein PilO